MARHRHIHRISPPLEPLESRRLLAQILVTTLDDSGDGSLRSAITQANAMTDHDDIVFAPGLTGTIHLASALPGIRTDMNIEGPGPDLLTIRPDTAGAYDVLHTDNFPTIRISGLTLTNGRYGIGTNIEPIITITNCRITGNFGNGISNSARMVVEHCTISDNSGVGIGTAISRSLTVRNSTISGNSGGGIWFQGISTGSVTIILLNSTISGNSANGSGGGVFFGGHLINPTYRLTILDCTITDNRADADGNGSGTGGGIHLSNAHPGGISIVGNIIAGNFRGTGTVSDDVHGFGGGGGNFIGGNPMLGPLADNGGPTLTHALLPQSPAIDGTGVGGNDLETDQRGPGFARYVGSRDFGAFEVQNTTIRHRALLVDTLPHRLALRFNTDVSASLELSDITVEHLPTQTIVSPTSLSYDATTNTATFVFDGMLDEGTYRAVIEAADVVGANGLPIHADEVYDFFFLLGDANQDGRVNLADFNRLAANFGQSPRTFTQGDFNYDGEVNLADFNILASRFGQILGPDPSGPGATTASRFGSTLIGADEDERVDLLN